MPSGRRLADAVAAEVDMASEGPVVELGPGTGPVTRAILDRGVAPRDLIAVENDPGFVGLLRRQFPGVAILEGDAFRFAELLRARNCVAKCRTIVSGLPVLNRPAQVRRNLLQSALASLKPGAPFIQFSYGVMPPLRALR